MCTWGREKLYRSRTTDSEYSPYTNSFTTHAPYCGESLMDDIEEILRRVRPTDVYLPHPDDNHPDHYATYCFVSAALQQLDSEGESFARKIREHTYLVHRGDWPTPTGNHPRVRRFPTACAGGRRHKLVHPRFTGGYRRRQAASDKVLPHTDRDGTIVHVQFRARE